MFELRNIREKFGEKMKVLIISHNTFSYVQNMGKTFMSLFASFRKEELCQLYIYPTLPDADMCNSYFRISDTDILESYYRFNIPGRLVGYSENSEKAVDNKNSAYGNKRNRKYHIELIRDTIWKYSRWYSKKLRKWIDDEKPTHIFVAPGRGKFLYNIALKISKDYQLPIVTYVCDDYYGMDMPKSFFGRLWKRGLNRKFEDLAKRSSLILTICDELKDEYESRLNCKAVTVRTGASRQVAKNVNLKPVISSMTYMGGIGLNRYMSLADIGNALDKINSERNIDYKLDIYTAKIPDEAEVIFNKIKSIKLHGFISGDEFDKVFESSDVLIHIEAFDEKSMERVKNSVSTKIADSLASGIPFFAYGPACIASISYLKRNKCAVVATNKNELEDKLLALFSDLELRKNISDNAIEIAKENHNAKKTSEKLYKIFCEL